MLRVKAFRLLQKDMIDLKAKYGVVFDIETYSFRYSSNVPSKVSSKLCRLFKLLNVMAAIGDGAIPERRLCSK